MKTYKNLYPQITSFENLYTAYRKARRGKRMKQGVAEFERNLEENLFQIQDELEQHTYSPGGYRTFYIHEPKRRLIAAAPFRDRVVHHALCQVIEPIWERRFIFDTYANRVGKGTHRALDRAQQFARAYPYCLQCDVVQFFPSIDHQMLEDVLKKHIADPHALDLCRLIIRSGLGVLPPEYEMKWFAGDDLFAAMRPRGLPIGNLTSQFWGNIYLNGLDHFIKRELGCKAYVRYVDDVLLFGVSKADLHEWRAAIIQQLAGVRLALHEGSAQVFPTDTGIPFLGFRVYPTHRRLKYERVVRFRRRVKHQARQAAQGSVPFSKLNASIQGWVNHVSFGDTWGLRRAILGRIRL